MNDAFDRLVAEIPAIGVDWHTDTILANARANAPHAKDTIRGLLPEPERPCLIVSAGPSLYAKRSLERVAPFYSRSMATFMRATFNVVAIDGSYVQCLRAGIIPDYVLTLDPHPTRIVRWFGDPDFAANSAGDDYFARQDLDEAFRADAERTNAENIALVDDNASKSGLIIACTAPANVVARTAAFKRLWFAPLVDNPRTPGSLTRQMSATAALPALNTGGTVGTAAIIFAHQVLKSRRIAVIGMDMGYAADLPHERTQSWNMLKDRKDVADLYPRITHPQWGECYTDATYAFYKQNLLALLKAGDFEITNCTEGGALFGPRVECMRLEDWANG